MKTRILILLSIIISIIFIGAIKVDAYSYAHSAEELSNILGDATHSGNVVKLENDVNLMYEEIMIYPWDTLILDLNGFSISGAFWEIHSDLYVKNGTIEGRMAYWGILTVENAIMNRLDGQAESFTNVKGTSTLNGITLGNLIIEKDATLVIDENDFEFRYHDYNENGHLCTNNGTIIIKDTDSEFEIESGNNILNNGNIINNGTYTNNGNNLYEVIIPNTDNCKITSNHTVVSKDEEVQLFVEIDEGYILKSITAYKLTDKNTIVNMENNSFLMPDFSVIIDAEIEAIKNIDYVEITGATIPKIGNVPVTSGLKVPDLANYKIVSAVWGTWSKEIGPLGSFEAIKTNNKFEKGKAYALEVTLHSLDKYTSFESVDVTINGIKCSGLLDYINSESVCLDKASFYLTFDELIEDLESDENKKDDNITDVENNDDITIEDNNTTDVENNDDIIIENDNTTDIESNDITIETGTDATIINPQTGDKILLFIGTLAISVIGIFITRKMLKK